MSYNLLVVDDSPDVGRLLELILTKAGYNVALAIDGKEALMLIKQNPPDLVLLDIMLPNMDGYEVCSRIHESLPGLPVLMLSSLDSPIDQRKSIAVGACEHISKPFDRSQLLVTISQHLGDHSTV